MRKLASWSIMILTLSLMACGGSDAGTGEEAATDPEALSAQRCGTIAGLSCPRGQYCDTGVGSCRIADAAGVCRSVPRWCTMISSPVCGCDGNTYANACAAAMAQVVVDHAGACAPKPVTCGGIAGLTCPSGQYCELATGACRVADAAGTCRTMPQGCTADYAPVCGCDGKTYSNACAAAAVGVNVDTIGACAPKEVTCGGITGATCPSGQYCDLGVGACRVADAAGTCRARGEVCTDDWNPVCGCDGKTYSNACAAAVAGMNVDHTGECTPAARSCGGTTGTTCAGGQYCQYPEGQCRDYTAVGTCTTRPDLCLQVMDPVCGCDGRTYYNGCAAAAAGVSVAHRGSCP